MRALVLVDLQNDFMPGGALAVPEGGRTVDVANRLMAAFPLVAASRDWHPPNHGSFASQHPGHAPGDVIQLEGLDQILWPDHCVQGTWGADLQYSLQRDPIKKIVDKGVDPKIDSYSAFFDNARRRSTGLSDYLHSEGVDEVFLMGLATDYCVKASAIDAAKLGFRTAVIEDGCRGIDLRPGDCEQALEEMRRAGVQIVRSDDLLAAP